MPDVVSRYLLAAFLVGLVCAAALLVALLVARTSRSRNAYRGLRHVLTIVGVVVAGTALLEQAGWSAHPWSLGSPAQEFNDVVFRTMSLLGLGLVFLSEMLGLFVRDERKADMPMIVERKVANAPLEMPARSR